MPWVLPAAIAPPTVARSLEEPGPAPAPQTPEALLLLGVVLQAARDVGRDDGVGRSARAFLEDGGVQGLIEAAWGVEIDSGVDPRRATRLIHRHNVEKGRRVVVVADGRREDMPRKREMNPDKVKVGYYISRAARERLQRLADREHRSISMEVEALIEEWERRALPRTAPTTA